jgi:hypothetical protein
MENDQRQKLASELITLIEKGNAHVTLEDATAGLTTGAPHGDHRQSPVQHLATWWSTSGSRKKTL